MSLREEFPVCARLAFLNAGSDGPVPRRAMQAAQDEIARQADEGRYEPYFVRRAALRRELAQAYAALLGADPDEVSLTTTTTHGIALAAAGFGRSDRIVTTDEEHPGVYGALGRARERGAEVTVAPFDSVHEAVDGSTSAVFCSHVSWMRGAVAPAELAELDVPVVLDGAQGVGAVPVDVKSLGCAAYAGSGQKWLCGPDGSGMLYVAAGFRERVPALVASYWNLSEPDAGLDAPLWPDARRWDSAGLSGETTRYALASLEVLAETGWDRVQSDGTRLAALLVELLAADGHTVLERGETTLVTWEAGDPPAAKARALDQGVVIRDIPRRDLLRASVGAWNDEGDLERLLGVL